jgi:ABC-type Zn uptake system ZnuABC Zn-binding protein ZnuA
MPLLLLALGFLGWIAPLPVAGQAAAGATLRLCVSTPDIESLAKEVGGPRVTVFCFSTGPQDPHEIEIRPSFARELDAAHLFVQAGLGLENAWLKNLLRPVKNDAVKPGGPGNLNAGRLVRPLEGEAGQPVPNSYHEEGNPHYLLDPIEGLKAARALRDRLAQLRPEWKGEFDARYESFRRKLTVLLAGEECADDDAEKLALDFERATTPEALRALLAEHKLGGWLGALAAHRGHLRDLVGRMKQRNVRVLLTAPYFEQRHAQFVAKNTGVKILPMCHQTGGRDGTDHYLLMLRHNFEQVINALKTP